MRNLAYVVVFASVVAVGSPAWADLPPPDACTAPGQPCDKAGSAHDQSGTCTMSTCTKTVPSADGGTMSMSYACNLCKVAQGGGGAGTGGANGGTGSGGANGGTGSGGANGGTGTGGADGAKPPSKDSGCALGGHVPVDASGAAVVLAGVLGILHARRRRRS
jgi:hypothetical protein